MKKILLFVFAISLFSATLLTSCGGDAKKQEAPAAAVQEQYQCPMKCTEEIFDKPGKCAVCGMELEKITKS